MVKPIRARIRRRAVDDGIDWLRFRVDTFPRGGPLARFSSVGYQPLPWVGIEGGRRAEGSWTRWRAIERELEGKDGLRTAVDIGANNGFFTIKLAERGMAAVAVEGFGVAWRTALYAMQRSDVADRTAVYTLMVTPDTLDLLPEADVVLFLSLVHHFARSYGFDEATVMLQRIWGKTRRTMFFDTGENEMPPEFNLPQMEPDATSWLQEYLERTCAGATVRQLGRHEAFDAEGRPAMRTLFAIERG